MRRHPPLLPGLVAVILGLGARPATAQGPSGTYRYTVNRPYSLAWYQIDPHVALLWATTCPADPFWRPGESRNSAGGTNGLAPPKTGYAAVSDTTVPLYKRPAARPLCQEAVEGQVTAEDTVTWHGVHGRIVMYPDSLESGLASRDRTARTDVFGTWTWRTIEFEIDSLVNVTPGDTMRAQAMGTFHFRNVQTPMVAQIVAWHEPPGLRVMGRLDMVPVDLVESYGVSIYGIRLGLQSGGWRVIHFGVDVILNHPPE